MIDSDSPPWTAADHATARPAGEVLPSVIAAQLRGESLRRAVTRQGRLARASDIRLTNP